MTDIITPLLYKERLGEVVEETTTTSSLQAEFPDLIAERIVAHIQKLRSA